jgi:hypothetical protein
MENKQDYLKDLAEIRSMMERSSKFLSLSGWAGVLAGIYALVGAYIAHTYFRFRPLEAVYGEPEIAAADLRNVILLAGLVLVLAVGTAFLLSYRRSVKRNESFWNATSRRLLAQAALPLGTGGLMILVLMSYGLTGILAPLTLVFYGLALYNAGNLSFREVRVLGLIQIGLGLASLLLIRYQLLFWAAGFGLMHIIYGIFIYLKYER